MEFYVRVFGSGLHENYIRSNCVLFDIPLGFFDDLYTFLFLFNSRLNEIDEILTSNRI
jgi:NADH:ubiquinone oxidoreductase subunit D